MFIVVILVRQGVRDHSHLQGLARFFVSDRIVGCEPHTSLLRTGRAALRLLLCVVRWCAPMGAPLTDWLDVIATSSLSASRQEE